jgi:hypothetical protein
MILLIQREVTVTMPTTPLERLHFLQGGMCFFCKQPLPKSEASVEHLYATANGGPNHDDNCVVCCKSLNRALGSMSLKAKIEVVLNQKGDFQCPNRTAKTQAPQKATAKPPAPPRKAPAAKKDFVDVVRKSLKSMKDGKPHSLKKLLRTVESLVKQHKSTDTAEGIVAKLQAAGAVVITDDKVTYSL